MSGNGRIILETVSLSPTTYGVRNETTVNYLENYRLSVIYGNIADSVGFTAKDFVEFQKLFDRFPTIGAEFHIPDISQVYPNFWERLAILNMSQSQKGSAVPFSRNDQGVVEIRMNPSYYPVAIANWNLMRLILPELNQCYFTLTLNRWNKMFSKNSQDKALAGLLHSLGNLVFAAISKTAPLAQDGEIKFGERYLGMSVRVQEGKYHLEGAWLNKAKGSEGQLNIFAGFGDIFPELAYFLSMGIIDPEVLKPVKHYLGESMLPSDILSKFGDQDIQYFLGAVDDCIQVDQGLQEAIKYEKKIIARLSP